METQTYEAPSTLNAKNIIYWSPSLKTLEGVKQCGAIKTKAQKFLKLGLVGYDPETKAFNVRPIPGYNKTTYFINSSDGHFNCTCQFYNTVSKEWLHPTCSHIQAVKFYLEMKRWNQK